MFKRFLKIFIAVVICVCVMGSVVSVFADPIPPLNIDPTGGSGLEDTTAPTEPTPPPTTETITTEPETSEEEQEEEEEEEEEEQEEEDEEEETTEETTENDGSFKVYLELNGGKIEGIPMEPGKTYLTNDMEMPGLVPMPADPTKAGYLFDGWYSDEGFTKVWDFASNFAFEEMTIYAKWIRDPAAILYDITVIAGKGGKITVRPEKAAVGETVLIMIQPEEGMRLKKGSLFINGEPSDILSFEMPAGPVVVEAEFELTPIEEQKKDNSAIIVGVAAVVAIIIVVVVILIIRRRNNTIIVPEFDEDGAIIIEDDEEVWIDESIVVESGFREGKKASDINPPKIEDFDNTISINDLNKE